MHVFFIHSHITYVLAKLFISTQKLADNDIRFITSRSYKLCVKSKTLDITNFYDYLESCSRFNKFFNLKRKLKELDNDLILLTEGNPYCAYLPQFNHSLFQFIATHCLCKNTVLVEEGITAYKSDKKLYQYQLNEISFSQELSRIFFKRFLLKNPHYRPFPENKFKFAICIDESCFPYIKQKNILSTNNNVVSDYKEITKGGDVIFVLDSFKERTNIKDREYFNILKKTLSLLKSHKSFLHIKFHPEQNESIREKTLIYLENNFEFQKINCLGDDCILEFEFLKSKNLTILGMHTSLLFYGKRFGHKVLSSLKFTIKYPRIENYVDHVMDESQKEEYKNYA